MISGWKVVSGVKTMYNLEVQQDHTYTVGVGQWIVHNFNCTSLVQQAEQGLSKSAKAVSNVIDTVTGDPVVRNSGAQVITKIGSADAFIEDGVAWSGHCAETRCNAQIAWLFERGRAAI